MGLIDQTDLTVKLPRFDTIVRGDMPLWTLTVYDDDGALPISGYSIWATAKLAIADLDAAAIFQKTVGDGITLTSPSTGVFTLQLANADTASLDNEEMELYFDIQILSGSGKLDTVFRGTLLVLPDVTLDT